MKLQDNTMYVAGHPDPFLWQLGVQERYLHGSHNAGTFSHEAGRCNLEGYLNWSHAEMEQNNQVWHSVTAMAIQFQLAALSKQTCAGSMGGLK